MNPYIGYVYSKGRDEFSYPSKLGEFPKTVQGVRFETEEEYRAAIHEMLNGMWQSAKFPLFPPLTPKVGYLIEVNQTESNFA